MRLALVTYLTADYDRAIAFLSHVGFDLREDTDLGDGKRWVRMGLPGGTTEFLVARAVGPQTDGIGQAAGGRVAYFLHTEDFGRSARAVEAAGGQFEEPPREKPYGKVAVFRDPEGNRWDLIAPSNAQP